MANLNFTMGNEELRIKLLLGLELCFFFVSPVPIVVPGTQQVPGKCFLGEYSMNVSENNNNNNSGCEQRAQLSVQNFILSQWLQVHAQKCLMFKIMSFLKFCRTSTSGYYALIHCDFMALLSL